MKIFSAFILCSLVIACTHSELGTEYKNQNGIFICKIKTPKSSTSSCYNKIEFTSPPAFSIASFGRAFNESNSQENTVYLFNSNHDCAEVVSFFPVGLITLTSPRAEKTITIGLTAEPKMNEKEITNFFYFQMNYSQKLKTTTEWIEENYNNEWLVTGWQDEIAARSNLEKIIRGF